MHHEHLAVVSATSCFAPVSGSYPTADSSDSDDSRRGVAASVVGGSYWRMERNAECPTASASPGMDGQGHRLYTVMSIVSQPRWKAGRMRCRKPPLCRSFPIELAGLEPANSSVRRASRSWIGACLGGLCSFPRIVCQRPAVPRRARLRRSGLILTAHDSDQRAPLAGSRWAEDGGEHEPPLPRDDASTWAGRPERRTPVADGFSAWIRLGSCYSGRCGH